MKDLFLAHQRKYPSMRTQDYLKLLYQNCYGPAHLHENPDADTVLGYLDRELTSVLENNDAVLEDIGNDYLRVPLCLVKGNAEKTQLLLRAFLFSMASPIDLKRAERRFYDGIQILTEMIQRREIKLPLEEALRDIREYLLLGIRPVHHSDIYQQKYQPHYRVVLKSQWKGFEE